MAEQPPQSIKVRVRFPNYEETAAVYANHASVQLLGHDFIVGFYAAFPPAGSPEDTASLLKQEVVEIPANCVARLVIPKERMPDIVRVLSQNLSRANDSSTPAQDSEGRDDG